MVKFKRKEHLFPSIIAILFIILAGSGCQKSPINGDLDGRWQILSIEHDGIMEEVKEDQLYYNFYLHVCNLSIYGDVLAEANFLYENNQIYLDFPYVESRHDFDNLMKYGIYSNPVIFEIIFLDKKRLVMGNDKSVITLRKF